MRCRVYCKMNNYNRKIILLREFRGKKKNQMWMLYFMQIIWHVIFRIKVPSLDGLPRLFYKHHWHIFGEWLRLLKTSSRMGGVRTMTPLGQSESQNDDSTENILLLNWGFNIWVTTYFIRWISKNNKLNLIVSKVPN